jgi:hypothetical protein
MRTYEIFEDGDNGPALYGTVTLGGGQVSFHPEPGHEAYMDSLRSEWMILDDGERGVSCTGSPEEWFNALPGNISNSYTDVVEKGVTKGDMPPKGGRFPHGVLKYDEMQPRDEDGRWTSGGGFEFVSPNVEENLSFDEASRRMEGDEQHKLSAYGQDVDKHIGIASHHTDAIGDWSKEPENTLFCQIKNSPSYEDVKYSAALKGDFRAETGQNQKAVIPFADDKAGKDSLYHFRLHGDMGEVRHQLDTAGLQSRTIIPTSEGANIWVFDQGTQMRGTMEKLGHQYDIHIDQHKGTGEFLGGDTRLQGHQAYQAVIQNYEKLHPGRNYARAGVPNLGRASATGEVAKENPNHDELGRFTFADGGGGEEIQFDAEGEWKAERYLKGLNHTWKGKLSIAEEEAVFGYTAHDYLPINSFLRGKHTPLPLTVPGHHVAILSAAEVPDKVSKIDLAIQKFTVSKPLVVYRHSSIGYGIGERVAGVNEIKDLVPGKEYVDKGYVSTSLVPANDKFLPANVSAVVSHRQTHVMAIHIPAGIHAAPVDGSSFDPGERELLLPRGCKFRVRNPSTDAQGYVHLDLVK